MIIEEHQDQEAGMPRDEVKGFGLYIHIPFCRKACHYCDFHFSTQLKYKDEMLACMFKELDLRARGIGGGQLQSVYFGGGTPSVLGERELALVMEAIRNSFQLSPGIEVTLEANPDDLSKEYLLTLKRCGINRLSIGVQSFYDEHLAWMNRSHHARQAIQCIDLARETGFSSINADLIFAIPGLSMKQWASNLQRFIDLGIEHWSCYNLTIEEKTVLHNWAKKGKFVPVPDQQAAEQYLLLMEMASGAGMEHYEISNFCKPGQYSVHNTHYWRGVPYLGIGPSAHSYDGRKRSWNIANNALYMKAVQTGTPFQEEEILAEEDRYNEFVLTGLRTKWGCAKEDLDQFDIRMTGHFHNTMKSFITQDLVCNNEGKYTLTNQGKLLADHITGALFWV